MKRILITVLLSLALFSGTDSSALENGTWIRHERQTPINDIQSIYSMQDGTLWVDTTIDSNHNFHTFDGVKWKLISKSASEFGTAPPLLKDSNDRFYFLNGNDLVVWDYNSPDDTPQTFAPSGSETLLTPMTAAISDDNILYLASFDYTSDYGGLYMFDGTAIERIKTGPVKSVTVDNTGRVWIVGKESPIGDMRLWSMENGEWTDRTDDINSALLDIETVLETSPDGDVWVVNLDKYGVYKDGSWSYHDGAYVGSSFSIAFDGSGGVWGYGNNDIFKLDGDGNWELSYQKKDTSSTIIDSYFLTVDSMSDIWMFYEQDIFKYAPDVTEEDEEQWVRVRSEFDLGSNIITSVAYTTEGYLVCGHDIKGNTPSESKSEGISILMDDTWHNFRDRDGLSFRNVKNLLTLDDGDVLIYSDTAYSLYDGKHFDKVDSLYYPDNLDTYKRYPNDMVADNMGDVWIATTAGVLYHDFIDYPALFITDQWESFNINYYNLFQAEDGIFYMQSSDDTKDIQRYEEDGILLSFDPTSNFESRWIRLRDGTLDKNSLIRDFVVELDTSKQVGILIWGIRNNNLVNNRTHFDNWDIYDKDADGTEMTFPNASLLDYDEEYDRIWVSGYDKISGTGGTGYLEDEIWHNIPELKGYASSVFARSDDDKIAVNAVLVNEYGDYPTRGSDDDVEYYGVFEFTPGDPTVVAEDKPAEFPVAASYPNPFNSSTTITFGLMRTEKLEISIYNMLGQHVKTLARGTYPAGTLNVQWDSTTESGNAVSSGIYFYHIKTEAADYSGKMLLLR
jgi:hypothetical protein